MDGLGLKKVSIPIKITMSFWTDGGMFAKNGAFLKINEYLWKISLEQKKKTICIVNEWTRMVSVVWG